MKKSFPYWRYRQKNAAGLLTLSAFPVIQDMKLQPQKKKNVQLALKPLVSMLETNKVYIEKTVT